MFVLMVCRWMVKLNARRWLQNTISSDENLKESLSDAAEMIGIVVLNMEIRFMLVGGGQMHG